MKKDIEQYLLITARDEGSGNAFIVEGGDVYSSTHVVGDRCHVWNSTVGFNELKFTNVVDGEGKTRDLSISPKAFVHMDGFEVRQGELEMLEEVRIIGSTRGSGKIILGARVYLPTEIDGKIMIETERGQTIPKGISGSIVRDSENRAIGALSELFAITDRKNPKVNIEESRHGLVSRIKPSTFQTNLNTLIPEN